ncbi:MAG: PorV/PorQ family protein [Ignavibacteriae bacterium]|nr:PorV/PorQ family protein [Ignavibacteriota bacterium]
MRKLTIIFILIVVSLLLDHSVYGQGNEDKNGTTAAQFLKIGTGARPMAMSGAYVALANDINSLYWNPSGISNIRQAAFSGAYTKWFADITHTFLGFVLPVGESASIGVHGLFLTMDPIQVTTINQPKGTGEFFEANDAAIGLTFAFKPVEFLSLGVTAKYIQQSIYNESASTFAFDFSSLLEIPYRGLKLGMHFSNIGGKLKLEGRDLVKEYDLNPGNTINTGVEAYLATQDWDLPVNFRVGLAMDLVGLDADKFVQNENHRLTLAVDVNHPSDAAEHVNLGIEYSFSEILMLRGGYKLNREIEKFFYGVGLKAPLSGAEFIFDYALASFDELDYIHIFSVSISFQ